MARYGGKHTYIQSISRRAVQLYITRISNLKKLLQVSLFFYCREEDNFFHVSGMEAQYNPYGWISLWYH